MLDSFIHYACRLLDPSVPAWPGDYLAVDRDLWKLNPDIWKGERRPKPGSFLEIDLLAHEGKTFASREGSLSFYAKQLRSITRKLCSP